MKKMKRVLAVLLSTALLVQTAPLQALAEENPVSAAAPAIEESEFPVDFSEAASSDLQVSYEIDEQRNISEKHFRLSDGSFIAASYPGPVHYETEDGTWEDIDNTLVLSQASRYSLGRIAAPGSYEAKNGEETKRYSAVLRPDESLLSLTNRGYGVGLSLLRPDTAQTLIVDKAVKPEEEPAESNTESSSSLEPEPEEIPEPSESSDMSSMISEDESISSQPESSELPGSGLSLESEGEIQEEPVSGFAEEEDFPVSSVPSSLEDKKEAESSAPSADQGALDEETSLPSDSPESSLPEDSDSVSSNPEEDSTGELSPSENDKTETTFAVMAASVSAKIENPQSSKPGIALAPGNHINSIGVTDGNTEPELSLEEQVQPEKISSKVTYENIWPGVDLQYYNYGYNIKESIIVNQPQKSYEYSFLLNLEDLTPVLQENGSVDLLNENKEIVYQIPAPYMVDAGQTISYDVAYELTNTSEGHVLTVKADEKWIGEKDRQFPVTIDPTLVLYGSDFGNSFTATCVTTEYPDRTGSGGESLYIGHKTTGDEMQVFFQFASLPTIPANCNVVNATLNLYQHTYSQVGLNRIFVQAHEVTSSRPANYASNAEWIRNMTWNTKPSFSSVIQAYARITEASKSAYSSWDISRLVSKWYSDSTANRMLAMDAIGPDNFSSTQCANGVFWMNINSKPLFLIHYRNNVGLESRYTYQTASAGRAGVANIGDYSGRLTLANTLFSNNSEAMPFSLTAYYNSPYNARYFTVNTGFGIHTANYTTMYVGSGWKLSVQETVVSTTVKTNNVSTAYYVYTDADGTEHYFEAPSSQSSYQDEDGLGLTLSVSGATSTLKDEKNNKKEFYNGYLTKQTDRNGNAIYYLYNDNTTYSSSTPFNPSSTTWKPKAGQANRVTQVWQVNDNGSATDVQTLICKFVYSGNFVSKITDASGRAYTFQYVTPSTGAQQLSKITFPDGHYAQYEYSTGTHLPTKIYDEESKSGLELAYQSSFQGWCVQKVHEYIASTINGTQTVGNAWHSYSSSLQQRQYRFYGQDHTANTEDDITTRYTFDLVGRTINAVNYNHDWTKVLGTSALSYTKNQGTNKTNNRVTGAAASGIAAVSRIQNGGLEISPGSNYGWTQYIPDSGPNTLFSTSVSEVSPAIKPRTGSYLMKLYYPTSMIYTTGYGRAVGQYQTVYLEAGTTYVFSGYANSSAIKNFGSNGGLYLSFQDSTGYDLVKSRVLNYATSTKVEAGWTRLQVSYTPNTSGNYRVVASLRNASEYAAFDDLQLEEAAVISQYMITEKQGAASSANLVQLGSLENWSSSGALSAAVPSNWTYSEPRVSLVKMTGSDAHRGVVFQMLGHPDAKRRASQTVAINRSSNTTYMLSAWGKANSVTDGAPVTDLTEDNTTTKRFFGMIAKILYSDTTTPEYQYVTFNPQFNDWQHASGFIVPKRANKTVTSITVALAYDYNVNTAWFDQISLTEEPAQTYTYDSNGKLKTVTTSAQSTDTYTYSGPDLTKLVSASSGTFTYTYDSSHNMTKATNDGVNLTAGYDTAGNNTSAKLQKGTSGVYMQSSATYTSDKNHPASVTDVNGITTSYTYDGLGRVSSVKTPYAGGTLTVNQQFASGTNDRISTSYITGSASLVNAYDKGQISAVTRKTYNGTTPSWQKYLTPTDSWGNVTKVQVQSGDHAASEANVAWKTPITLASYKYKPNNGPLTELTYGNGDYNDYYYDVYGRPVSIFHFSADDSYEETYTYDSNGNISQSAAFDCYGNLETEYFYEYDSLGRLIQSEQFGDTVTSLRTQHKYDAQNRLSTQLWQLPGQSLWESFTYNNANGTLKSMTLGTGREMSFGYDNLLRLQSKTLTGIYQHRRNYTGTGTANRETQRVDYFNYYKPDGTTLKIGYRYTYDAAGNIKQVYSREGTKALALESSYEYDKLGQLTFANTGAGNETYTYDTAGNLLSRTIASTTRTYGYDNTQWGDLLTTYQGQRLAYEGQSYNSSTNTVSGSPVSGNPVSYYNGRRWTMAWENGHQLASAVSSGKTVTYEYDKNGLRTSKTYNGTRYDYAYAGDKLMWQGWNGNEMYFFYDNAGTPVAFWYFPNNGGSRITGYYLTNQQGDVVRIEDPDGNVLASYSYNAWGRVYACYGSMEKINPLRYRGYYCDDETGFYYLQNRYYDPGLSRFINADSYASTGQGFLGYNMFAYCGNDPVNNADSNGNFARAIDYDNCGAGGIGLIWILGLSALTQSTQSMAILQPKAKTQEKEQEKDTVISSEKSKNRPQFPENPDEFAPRGLVKNSQPGTDNGRIILWQDPLQGNSAIFEWDEDFRYGPHYHARLLGGELHDGNHYKSGDLVPPELAVIYFGE